MTFDSGNESDRRQIERLYRAARVISHVAADGHIVIEADVARRDVERLMQMTTGEGVADVV